tara:strand:- start:38 stop:994 length:957 start_codon:yes stop_codon:yes gene_type:complete
MTKYKIQLIFVFILSLLPSLSALAENDEIFFLNLRDNPSLKHLNSRKDAPNRMKDFLRDQSGFYRHKGQDKLIFGVNKDVADLLIPGINDHEETPHKASDCRFESLNGQRFMLCVGKMVRNTGRREVYYFMKKKRMPYDTLNFYLSMSGHHKAREALDDTEKYAKAMRNYHFKDDIYVIPSDGFEMREYIKYKGPENGINVVPDNSSYSFGIVILTKEYVYSTNILYYLYEVGGLIYLDDKFNRGIREPSEILVFEDESKFPLVEKWPFFDLEFYKEVNKSTGHGTFPESCIKNTKEYLNAVENFSKSNRVKEIKKSP